MTVSFNANQNRNNESSYKNDLKGTALGLTSAIGTAAFIRPFQQTASKKLQSFSEKLTPKETDEIKLNANKILYSTRLAKTGTTIEYLTDSQVETNVKAAKSIKVDSLKSYFNKKRAIKNAKPNGSYNVKQNKVLIKGTKYTISVFHELGHGIDTKLTKFGNANIKLYKLRKCAFPLIIASLLLPTKKKNTTKKSFSNKIKDNIAGITFATFVPTLISEFRASQKGIKEASKVLTPKLLNETKTAYKYAFGTYAFSAGIMTLIAYMATAIQKDYVKTHSKQ